MVVYEENAMSVGEQADLKNANALKEKIEKQGLLIEYLAGMVDIEIPSADDEGGIENVQYIEENEG